MKTEFSIQDILDLNPCDEYDEKRIKELFNGREKCSVEEILDFDIIFSHKFWFIKNAKVTCCLKEKDFKMWFKKGKRHREGDKPSAEYKDGTKVWFKNDKFHRDNDKPAMIQADGTVQWYMKGRLSRENGKPAVIHADGKKEWWVKGKHIKIESASGKIYE